jgi:hypothetical protein
MFPDLSPLFYLAIGFVGAAVGLFVSLIAWIFIPAGAWMLIPPVLLAIAAMIFLKTRG